MTAGKQKRQEDLQRLRGLRPIGVSEMCKVIEDMRKESLIEVALRMLKTGKYALDEIANISGLSLDEVKNLQAGHNS